MINTVQGKISDKDLGITYIHEHLYVYPDALPEHRDYTLDDIDKNISEVISFKNAGGGTLVDLTPINYGRSPMLLRKIAQSAGINIICVTGFHKEEFQPKWLESMTNQRIYDLLIDEIKNGIGDEHILPGAMKLGTSFNKITDSEKRIINIEGSVQHDARIPIITHCDGGTMGLEQLQGLRQVGADLTHVCLSHVDLSEDVNYIEKICDTGASVSFDHVGRHLEDHDALRVSMIAQLVFDGYVDHICLAGDMGRKKYLISYGGRPGLRYILTDLRTALLDKISELDYEKMVTDNPARILMR
ncbi:Aryldialkylphosphatase [Oenococcus oeni]|uniref:phosphotriesterase family protein n=1 Tax=Oenococcus oeni TaxID=1247 RepID=UPI0010B964BD|nr:aryldialkylphosphatase [Oenococcus oeni]SYW05533.1 Aryldialkylphosphatase [Oenococcus oeni]